MTNVLAVTRRNHVLLKSIVLLFSISIKWQFNKMYRHTAFRNTLCKDGRDNESERHMVLDIFRSTEKELYIYIYSLIEMNYNEMLM